MLRKLIVKLVWSGAIIGVGMLNGAGAAFGITPEVVPIKVEAASPSEQWVVSHQAERASGEMQLRRLKRMFSNQELRADQFYEKMQSLLSKRR